MVKCKYGRHIPSFVLLFLAQEPAYGLELLNKMEGEMPFCRADSAAVYRALQDLEKDGALESFWDTSEPGPARKWYKITGEGYNKLAKFKEDIEKSINNLEYFLVTYEKLNTLSKEDG